MISHEIDLQIGKRRTFKFLNQLRELWRYRELAIELFWTYLKLRYVGSVLGFIWTMLNPILYIVTYWIVFTFIVKMGLSNYPLYLIPGFLAWNFTFGSLVSASESILNSQYLITKISFPIEILTITSIAVTLFDFFISLTLYLIAVMILTPSLSITVLALPSVIIIQVMLTAGLALFAACVSVFFRDIPKLIPVLGTMVFFLTPIFYPLNIVPESFRFIIKLNPMTQIVTLYQNILYYRVWPDYLSLGFAFLIGILFLITGYWVFDRKRHTLAELC